MKSSLLGMIVFASVGTGGLLGAIAVAREDNRERHEVSPDLELERAVHGLAAEVERLGARLAELEQPLAGTERLALDSSALSTRGESTAPLAGSQPRIDAHGEEPVVAAGATDLEGRLDELIRMGAREQDVMKFFDEARDSGELDAVIAALEARIQRDPTDPKNHYLLAKACYARLMLESSPAGYQKWGDRTLAAWDRSIALDPGYWEPRFERAEYLTYFPESEGKTPELITELEQLLDLQAGSTANPRFADTYAHLARMYLRLGMKAEALQVLAKGVALFPDDGELQQLYDVLNKE